MQKSKARSAKVAWGTNTGYADQLRSQGVETSRAQQLENWANQQEVLKKRQAQRALTDQFDEVNHDEDWRTLAKFGVERNQVRYPCARFCLFLKLILIWLTRWFFHLGI